jgi:hypothetical protein
MMGSTNHVLFVSEQHFFLLHFFSTLGPDQKCDWTDRLRAYLKKNKNEANMDSFFESGRAILVNLQSSVTQSFNPYADQDFKTSPPHASQELVMAKSSESGSNQSYSYLNFAMASSSEHTTKLLDDSYKLSKDAPTDNKSRDLFLCLFLSTLPNPQQYDWAVHLKTYLKHHNENDPNRFVQSGYKVTDYLDISRRPSATRRRNQKGASSTCVTVGPC